MIVFGKTAPDAALVTLTGLEVISSFSEDFNGEDGEISELITLEGTAAVSEEGELRITEAANSRRMVVLCWKTSAMVQHSATSSCHFVCSWVTAQPARQMDSALALTTIFRTWPARLRKVLATA